MALTIFASEIIGALADIIVDAIDTGATILAHMILTIVNVVRAIDAMETGQAVAAVVGEVIQALGSIGTGIELEAAELYLCIAPFARETGLTFAAI